MNNFKNRNSMFIIFTGIIIALGRFLLGTIKSPLNSDDSILIIMAVVNYVALGFVLLFLYNEFCQRCKNKISTCGLGTEMKKKCNNIVFTFSTVLIIIYLLFGILYMMFFKTSGLNDVLSILALATSIATNGLVCDYGDDYYKLVLKISKTKFKKVVQ